MNDMVSVILPAYNRRDYIEECIRSVQAQSYKNFEIIVIDDGSTDGTPALCRQLAEKDSRIKLWAGDHAGVSAARNKALEVARGEYVFFLDSDDVIHPLLLETLVKGMQESGAQMSGTRVASVNEKFWYKTQERLQQPPTPAETTYKTHKQTLQALFHGDSPFGMIGGVMMRRDYIGDTRFRTDLFVGEDYYFVYQNLIKGANTVFLKDKKWYYARNHANNISWDWSYKGFWTRFCRRKLVWESEESFGRKEYADIQKRDAFSVFLTCFQKNKWTDSDSKKMCRVIREHKTALLPALVGKTKLICRLAAVSPVVCRVALHLFKKLKTHK